MSQDTLASVVSLKRCCTCKQFKLADAFYKSSGHKDGLQAKCKDCQRPELKSYQRRNRDHLMAVKRRYNAALRLATIAEYGGKCECCGESHQEFLAFDHVYGDGSTHRKTIGGSSIYIWLRRHGYPKDKFRLLCHNCNCSLGFYGYCPHGTLGPATPEMLSPDELDDMAASDCDPELISFN